MSLLCVQSRPGESSRGVGLGGDVAPADNHRVTLFAQLLITLFVEGEENVMTIGRLAIAQPRRETEMLLVLVTHILGEGGIILDVVKTERCLLVNGEVSPLGMIFGRLRDDDYR